MAKLTSCYSCVKYLMFAFNFLFWLLGCTVLAVGVWIKVDPNSLIEQQDFMAKEDAEQFRKLLEESKTYGYQSTGAYILIAVGSFIMCIGFLGCCGAIRENQCMLGSFFVALSLIFAVLLAAGVYAIIAKNNLETHIQTGLDKAVKLINSKNDTSSRNLMDFVHRWFKCCGATRGAVDYTVRPDSCGGNDLTPCPRVIYQKLTPNFVVIAGVAIGIAVVLVMGMVFSIMLCCAIRSTAT